MRVYLLSPPAIEGIKMVREGRCMAREGVWTTLWPPISMAEIAAVLEARGMEARITDAGAEEVDINRLKDKIDAFAPDLLMINTATPTIEYDLSMAAWAKKHWSGIRTAAFGIHVSQLPKECMTMQTDLDFIVRNEPELTAAELAETLEDGSDPSTVLGITYRKGDEVVTTPPRPYVEDLDSLPFPAWHRVDTSRYVLPYTKRRYLLVASARGCPHRCTFCVAKGYYGNRVRLRSPESVVRELQWIGERFGIFDFLFWTESFTLNRKLVMGVCEGILEKNLKIRWVCNSRVDHVDPEMLAAMKRAGCWMIGYGVESSSQEVLDRAKKGITVEQIEKATRWAREAGIQVSAHIVFGLPGDTRETIRDTIRFAKRMRFDYAQFYCATPWPGSTLYQMAQKENWIKPGAAWSDFEQNTSVLHLDGLAAEEITRLREEGFRSFYLYPLTIWRTLLKIKSFNELKNFLWMIQNFLTWSRG